MSGIYKISNIINAKVYIGRTSQPFKQRWKHYKCDKGENRPIAKAIRKYGFADFTFEILELIDSELPLIHFIERETYWIKEFDAYNRYKGYNRGRADSGVVSHKESSKRKTRESLLAIRKIDRDFDCATMSLDKWLLTPRNIKTILFRIDANKRIKDREVQEQFRLDNRKHFVVTYRNGETEKVFGSLNEWCESKGYSLGMIKRAFRKIGCKGVSAVSKYSAIKSITYGGDERMPTNDIKGSPHHWLITFRDGTTMEIENRAKWIRDNGYSPHMVEKYFVKKNVKVSPSSKYYHIDSIVMLS